MNTTALQAIIDFIFGHKYYANIIHTVGTPYTDLSSFIFITKKDAVEHKISLEQNLSYKFIETISFRSRKTYTTHRL